MPNAVLTLGSHDTDGDGRRDIGYVSLVSPSGSLLSQIVYSADTSEVWLVSMASVTDSTFLTAGSLRTESVTHPFVASFVVTSAGQLQKGEQTIITDLPACRFIYIEPENGQPTDPEWRFFAASRSETDTYDIHRITVTWPSLAPWSVGWSADIAVAGVLNPWVNGLRFIDGNLDWVGGADDPTKEPRPTSGGYWDSAVAGSITSTGQPRWATVVRTTGHSEIFSQFVATSGSLYALGRSTEFVHQDQYLGYGWICQLTTSTGGVVSNMTVGDQSYYSGFNDGILEGGTMHCVGWTREEVSGAYQGWFCDVDISATFAAIPVAIFAPIDDNDRAMPENRRSGSQIDG